MRINIKETPLQTHAKLVSAVGHAVLSLRYIFVAMVLALVLPLPTTLLFFAIKLFIAVVFVNRIYRLKATVEALVADTMHITFGTK